MGLGAAPPAPVAERKVSLLAWWRVLTPAPDVAPGPRGAVTGSAYSRDKLTFSMATSLFNVVRDIVFLVCGVLPFLWLLAGQLLETVAGIPPDSNEVGCSTAASGRPGSRTDRVADD